MNTIITASVDGQTASAVLAPIAIKPEMLELMGISAEVTPAIRKAAVSQIKAAGGYVPDGIDDGTLMVSGAIVRNAKAAEKSYKRVLLGLAILDKSETWKTLKDANGKDFTSVNAFFKAVFPSLSGSSTARNYLATANKFYLPAAQGTLDERLKPIADLEPATAAIASSIVDDKAALDAFPAALKEAQGNGKLTAAVLRKAVKAAKEAANPNKDKASDKSAHTTSTDIAAATDTALQDLRVACKRVFMPDFLEGEYHMTIGEDRVKDYIALINNATKSGENALLFVKAFAQALNVKP